jgi:hypothetical protein
MVAVIRNRSTPSGDSPTVADGESKLAEEGVSCGTELGALR